MPYDNEDTSDLHEILTHYGWHLPSQKSGWHTVKCGAHEDRHSSCRINYDIGRVKCMACDFEGDSIDVIKYYERLDFKDAKRRREELTGTSDKRVSTTTRRGGTVSNGSRYQQRRGTYTPSRLRSRTDDRA